MSLEYTTPQTAVVEHSSYISLAQAEVYFTGRLDSEAWDCSEDKDKEKALVQATRLIDRLNFEGAKTDETQSLEFPRNGLTSVSIDIAIATCEIAISLLDGVDTEQELNNLTTNSQMYGSVRETYDRTQFVEHFRAGIPSAVAWVFLKPFLHDSAQIKISRV